MSGHSGGGGGGGSWYGNIAKVWLGLHGKGVVNRNNCSMVDMSHT